MNIDKLIDAYFFDGRLPLKGDITNTLNVKSKLFERKKIVPRVLDKIMGFIEKFYDGGGSLGSSTEKAANSSNYANAISGNAMMAVEESEEYMEKSPKQ
ncbi:hypothetical protein WCX49_05690 [Sulfurimonas sp. HSL-1656]|uniref:hypothetical protein n=1 Tax=Thiomicrolovo subterrani TaxID=3131934 RepID=UPI0031F7DBC7